MPQPSKSEKARRALFCAIVDCRTKDSYPFRKISRGETPTYENYRLSSTRKVLKRKIFAFSEEFVGVETPTYCYFRLFLIQKGFKLETTRRTLYCVNINDFVRSRSTKTHVSSGTAWPTLISNKKTILQHLATPGFCLDFAPQKQAAHYTALSFAFVFATSGLRSLRSHPPYAKSLPRERRSGESIRCNTETIDVHKT